MIHTVAMLAGGGVRVVEVPLEQRRVRRHAADLADTLFVVQQFSVRADFSRRTFAAIGGKDLHSLVGDLTDTAARVRLATKRADRASVDP